MKRKTFVTIFQWLVSLFCWFTISPVFYYLTNKWELISKKLRIRLLLISPIFLILYIILCLYGVATYFDYQRKHRFADKEVLERITGVTYPDLKIIEYTKGRKPITGDYNDLLLIEFKETPSTAFYQSLDSLIATKNSNWSMRDNIYSYSRIWGNGFPAPKGEYDEEDMFITISLEKGSKQAIIDYGAW